MSTARTAAPSPPTPAPTPTYFRRNYWAFAFEGALYLGALNFISANTLLPKMLKSLGAPDALVCMAPMLNLIGFLPAPILCAHLVERLRVYRPFLLRTCLIQRIPYLLAALLLLVAGGIPAVAITALALTPFLSGVVGGVGLTPWQQLFTRCIPRDRRQSLFAFRFAVPGVVGILAGFIVEYAFAHWPGAFGYAILHLLAFAVLIISYFTFSRVREPTPPSENSSSDTLQPVAPPRGLITHLRSVPAEIMHDRHFLLLLAVRFFRNSMFIIAPLLAIHCQEDVLHLPNTFLGQLVIVYAIGALLGNLAAAFLGDRFGPKTVLLCGLLAYGSMSLASLAAATRPEWLALFILFGISTNLSDVGVNTLGLEMGKRERRSTFLAVAALVNLPGMLLAWSLALAFRHHFTWLAIATTVGMALAFAFLLPMRERHDTTILPPPAPDGGHRM